MDADFLSLLLAQVRNEVPGVSDEVLSRIERALRDEHGGRDHFVARRAKRSRLAEIEAAMQANDNPDTAAIARKMGLSVRRVQQLMSLLR